VLNVQETDTQTTDEGVMKRAKSTFLYRNRILYHYLNPGTSKYKLNNTLSAAWDALPHKEKQIYISQVIQLHGVK
jgi:hypothetical protein